MSMKSQEANLCRLAELLDTDLSYIWGERESGPNGNKKIFLNTGKAFLRALAKDLGLHDWQVDANAAGIAVSGECYLSGMWGQENGLHICLEQPCYDRENVLRYHAIRNGRDNKGGDNRYLRLSELRTMPYKQLLNRLLELREEPYERAA